MINSKIIALTASLLCLAGLCSCTDSDQKQEFLKINHRDSLGRYVFAIDFTDSLVTYDVDFYTRLDTKRSVFRLMDDIQVDVLWISPDGKEYAERVYIPKLSYVGGTAFSKEYLSPYRRNLSPVKPGVWTLCLEVPPIIGLRGMGVRYAPSEEKDKE